MMMRKIERLSENADRIHVRVVCSLFSGNMSFIGFFMEGNVDCIE